MILGINAVRACSGGAVAHLNGILKFADPRFNGWKSVHLWSYPSLLQAVPCYPYLIKHCPKIYNKSIFQKLVWEFIAFPHQLKRYKIDLLFNVDGGSVCRFRPSVTASQDMLSYEFKEMKRYGFSIAWLRLWVLKHVQNAAFRHANGVIFLTEYSGKAIQSSCGKLTNVTYIPHGVGNEFKEVRRGLFPNKNEPIRILYVSNIAPYKHQWMVVKAVAQLQSMGYNVKLKLVGGGSDPSMLRLTQCIASHDQNGGFVEIHPCVKHSEIPKYLAEADLFVFASSCENMPITLLEAMATGLPIACSDRGPMPEILGRGGVYFNPEDPATIQAALEILISDSSRRETCARQARQLTEKYSWERCGKETFSFLAQTAKAAFS